MNTALIVDGSLTARMDLQEALEGAGLHAIACASAREALVTLRERAVDLMILDMRPADTDGIDLMERIRADPATRALPILMLCGEADVRDRIGNARSGVADFIAKPYDRDTVVARARELLRLRAEAASSPAREHPVVLVIDDSTTFREHLREELEGAGYAVVCAASGEEGLRLAAAQQPAALIVDGVMPGMDGATVIHRLRLDVALRSLPCLLLTAAEERDAELQALNAGADAFVRKEEDFKVILARLGAILRSARAEPRAMTKPARPKRILAVDDSITYSHEIASLLRAEDYEVALAPSGEEAIEILGTQNFDCILLDLLMPGMGGKECCQRIKATPALRDIPLIVLTAVEDRQTLIEGLATGADDYISKSSDFDVLQARIQAQIRRKQFEDENRRIREQLLRSELEAAEARAARRLAEAKAELVVELERKNEEVRRLNEGLEQRVAERTRELERAYEDLRQTQQTMMQQERLRAFGQMASGIAHDINNALSPAALYTESILEREKHLSANTREQLTTVQRAIEDVAQTVARMREFYRKRNQERRLERVDINEIVRHVVELTRARWSDMPQEAGIVITMKVDLATDLPTLVGAENEIRDALTNLVLNAVDAMPAGGALTIRSRTTAGDAGAPMRVVVEVSDTGVGMDEETRTRCVEPFFTTKGERGTGLGLAMVYGMIQRHSGYFEVDSVPESGTTMRLTFPLLSSPEVASDAPRATTPTVKPKRILLVDDDPLLLKSLCDTLEADGHFVVPAKGGQAGIDAFHAAQRAGNTFALVITDLGMPHLDGRRVAAAVKAASASTPVILLTGWAHRLMAEGGRVPHVDRILSKPPKMADLRVALAGWETEANPAPSPR
ncbi:MAG TPA: response regulator [Steroidobacteraceae bacterium]|nr:response regulator [Steroidobacteraceae bacterium]